MNGVFVETTRIDYEELDGKTVTLTVGTDYDVLRGVKTVCVVGTEENGRSYVIVDHREPLNVHPNQR